MWPGDIGTTGPMITATTASTGPSPEIRRAWKCAASSQRATRSAGSNPALRADSLSIPHEDPDNQVLGFVRQAGDNVVLTIVNLGEQNFADHSYGVRTGGHDGQWTQILCTQDAAFGGWDGAGNAFYEPWTQGDGNVYINLPKWSVVMMRRK